MAWKVGFQTVWAVWAQTVWKPTFQATKALILREKTQFHAHIIQPTFKTDLRMLPQFNWWGLKKCQKMRWMLDNKLILTPCIDSHFLLISKKMAYLFNGQFFLAQSKRMVNNQTSQYELLILIFYLSHWGIFQYIREKLQVTVFLDHPVSKKRFSNTPVSVFEMWGKFAPPRLWSLNQL